MSKDHRQQVAQPQSVQQQPRRSPEVEAEPEEMLASIREDLRSTRELVLSLAEGILRTAKSHAKCRNCTRLACQFVTAAHRDFGTQSVALCDGCELTSEWRPTGTVSRITDPVLLETIKAANEIICSRPR